MCTRSVFGYPYIIAQSLSSWARIRNLILGRMSVIDEDLICTYIYIAR